MYFNPPVEEAVSSMYDQGNARQNGKQSTTDESVTKLKQSRLLAQGGFQIEKLDTGYLAPFPKCGSYCFWGVARLRGEPERLT